MKKRHKRYLKLNLLSLFFAAISFISITLAWFAYSGLVNTATQIDVKSWNIEFSNKSKSVSNELVISLPPDISPGMQTISETINVKNTGDSPATLGYEITSARILNETLSGEESNLEDKLSHDYPFHINMSVSDTYVEAHDGTAEFTVSVSWPLDSDNDEKDSEWGNAAYDFNKNEETKSAIRVQILLKAEQYLGGDTPTDPAVYNVRGGSNKQKQVESDPAYNLGDIVLYNYQENKKCSNISSTCIKSYIIDKDNLLTDTSVTLLPDLYNSYKTATANNYTSQIESLTSGWETSTRPLSVEDILPVVSKDVINTLLIRPNISNEIVGYLDYGDRLTKHIERTISYQGYYKFENADFPYFVTSKCYWLSTKYDDTHQFALSKMDETYSKIYNENKTTTCSVVPVAEVSKARLK